MTLKHGMASIASVLLQQITTVMDRTTTKRFKIFHHYYFEIRAYL